MTIAYLTSEYPAPSHTFIRREIAALRARGAEIHTFSVRAPHHGTRFSAHDEAERAGTFYILSDKREAVLEALREIAKRPLRSLRTLALAYRHRVPGVRSLVYSAIYFTEALCLARALEAKGAQHLHNHFANPSAIVGLLASKHLGLGFSFTVHGVSEFDGDAGALLPAKVAEADFVVCITSYTRSQIMRFVPPEEWQKLILSRCGVDVDSIPERVPEPDARKRLISVARLAPEKGVHGALDAFALIRERGVDAELHLIGDGPLRNSLIARCRELGIQDDVIFHGQLSDVEVFHELKQADVFFLASLMEGLPIVLMEALAAGVPVVAPTIAGIPELITDGETGLLYPASDSEALAEQLTRLVNDPGLGARLAARGRRRLIERHSLATAIEPLLQVFARRGLMVDRPAGERRVRERRRALRSMGA